MTTIDIATTSHKLTRRDLSAMVDRIMSQAVRTARDNRIIDTYLRIASYKETGRKLEYISWDVCPYCGCMCQLNNEPICGECEYNIAIAARHSSLWDDMIDDGQDAEY